MAYRVHRYESISCRSTCLSHLHERTPQLYAVWQLEDTAKEKRSISNCDPSQSRVYDQRTDFPDKGIKLFSGTQRHDKDFSGRHNRREREHLYTDRNATVISGERVDWQADLRLARHLALYSNSCALTGHIECGQYQRMAQSHLVCIRGLVGGTVEISISAYRRSLGTNQTA